MIEQILQADRHLQVDQVDRARGIYGRVVDMDPGNAIAVVGLARCALAEGDDGEAYALASRALEIDPENDMARRMEARLSEILASRGEAVERPPAASTPSTVEMRPVVTEATGLPPAEPPLSRPEPPAEPPAERPVKPPPMKPPTKPPVAAKEQLVRKSFFDRLLGR